MPGLHLSLSNKSKLIMGLCFISFALIAFFVITRETLSFDTYIREFIYSFRNKPLTVFFTAITCMGNWQTIFFLCALLLLLPKTRFYFGIPLSAASLFAVLIMKILKLSFQRQRPDISLHLIQQGGFSFPSGHSLTIIIFYGLMIYLCRENIKNRTIANTLTVLLTILILLIGFSRVYLGVHFPTDVLGGWSVGLGLLFVFIGMFPFLHKNA